jgi:hypothetical protein
VSDALLKLAPALLPTPFIDWTARVKTVIYLFSKEQRFLLCHLSTGQRHRLTVIHSDGVEFTEQHGSADDLAVRWNEVRGELGRDGWRGPFASIPAACGF